MVGFRTVTELLPAFPSGITAQNIKRVPARFNALIEVALEPFERGGTEQRACAPVYVFAQLVKMTRCDDGLPQACFHPLEQML